MTGLASSWTSVLLAGQPLEAAPAVDLEHAGVVGQHLAGAVPDPVLGVDIGHRRRQVAPPGAVVPGEAPEIAGAGFALAGRQHRQARVVAEQLGRTQDAGEQQLPQRLQPPCRPAHPVRQGGAVEMDAVALQDLGLAVQWQTVVVLRHRHLGQQTFGRQTAGDGAVRRRSLHDRLGAAPAAVERAFGDPDAQAQRHGIEALGLLDTDLVQRPAAARAAPVLRLDHHLIALEMGRQMTEVAPGRSPPGAPVRVATLRALLGGLGRRDLLLEVFQGELELIGIETLGLAAELGPQELPDHQFQPLALGIGLLEGALEVIALHLQSIERRCLPLNKGFHLDQPGQQLIWIGLIFRMTN